MDATPKGRVRATTRWALAAFWQKRAPSAFGYVLAATVGALFLVTVAVVLRPTLADFPANPVLDTSIDAGAMVVAATVALLAWIRYREIGDTAELFKASAFLALALAALATIVIDAQVASTTIEKAPLYIATLQRLTAAVLLFAGAWLAFRRDGTIPTESRRALLVIFAPALVTVFGALVIVAAQSALPSLTEERQLAAGLFAVGPDSSIQGNTVFLAAQLAIGVIYMAAAILYARRYQSRHDVPTAALAIGLIVAAFSQMHYAISPDFYSTVVTSGDLMRVMFYTILLLGLAAGVRQDLRALRLANTHLERIREADIADAASAERARLAREIHDGLVQDLWLARLRHGELESQLTDPDLRRSAELVDRALENAMAEARQAVVVLNSQRNPSGGFRYLLEAYLRDYASRHGIPFDFHASGSEITLARRVEAELLRIFREALNNIVKHADATVAVMSFETAPDEIRMSLSDNGKGFVLTDVNHGFGLASMLERAKSINATLEIDSEPMDGARVTVVLPTASAGP